MDSLYRRLRMRHGLRIGTGHTDWQFVYRCVLLVILFGYAAWTMKLDADLQATQAQVEHLEARLNLMAARVANCLNAGPVGFESRKGKQIWVVCGRAEEIVVDEI